MHEGVIKDLERQGLTDTALKGQALINSIQEINDEKVLRKLIGAKDPSL